MVESTQTKNVILFGKTGAGKSTVANILTGTKNFKESANMTSCTMEC
jgi:replication-associated recombination protein RarA